MCLVRNPEDGKKTEGHMRRDLTCRRCTPPAIMSNYLRARILAVDPVLGRPAQRRSSGRISKRVLQEQSPPKVFFFLGLFAFSFLIPKIIKKIKGED